MYQCPEHATKSHNWNQTKTELKNNNLSKCMYGVIQLQTAIFLLKFIGDK